MQKQKKKYMVFYDFHVCVSPKLKWRIVNRNTVVVRGTDLKKWPYLEDSAFINGSMTHQRVLGQDSPTSFLFLSTTGNSVCCSALCGCRITVLTWKHEGSQMRFWICWDSTFVSASPDSRDSHQTPFLSPCHVCVCGCCYCCQKGNILKNYVKSLPHEVTKSEYRHNWPVND